MDATNQEIKRALQNLAAAGIEFDVVDTCPDLGCEVCGDSDLSVAA